MSTCTESEAKKRWCPESRVLASDSVGNVTGDAPCGYNRGMSTPNLIVGGSTCMASQCMAWRWTKAEKQDPVTGHYSRLGYCGKAGKP